MVRPAKKVRSHAHTRTHTHARTHTHTLTHASTQSPRVGLTLPCPVQRVHTSEAAVRAGSQAGPKDLLRLPQDARLSLRPRRATACLASRTHAHTHARTRTHTHARTSAHPPRVGLTLPCPVQRAHTSEAAVRAGSQAGPKDLLRLPQDARLSLRPRRATACLASRTHAHTHARTRTHTHARTSAHPPRVGLTLPCPVQRAHTSEAAVRAGSQAGPKDLLRLSARRQALTAAASRYSLPSEPHTRTHARTHARTRTHTHARTSAHPPRVGLTLPCPVQRAHTSEAAVRAGSQAGPKDLLRLPQDARLSLRPRRATACLASRTHAHTHARTHAHARTRTHAQAHTPLAWGSHSPAPCNVPTRPKPPFERAVKQGPRTSSGSRKTPGSHCGRVALQPA